MQRRGVTLKPCPVDPHRLKRAGVNQLQTFALLRPSAKAASLTR